MAGFFARLFGGAGSPAPAAMPAVEHAGYTITPDPMPADGQWRVAARIEKDGRTHHLIRADTSRDRDEAAATAVAKARQMIDEQGDRLFD